MSEARSDLPPDTVQRLVSGFQAPQAPQPSSDKPFNAQQNVTDFWLSKGAPPHVAQAFADRVKAESGGDPLNVGDGGTSLGLYQHHNDRMKTLLANIQNNQAFQEMMGSDPIAAAHWKEILSAGDKQTAGRLIDKYFERSAASQRGGDISGATAAAGLVKQGYYDAANTANRGAQQAIAELGSYSKDLEQSMVRRRRAQEKSDEAEEAAMRALAKPPQQPELDGIKNFSGLATLVGIIGGAFTKRPLIASLNAAGAAMEAYNSRDLEKYKIARDQWKTNTEFMFKLADMGARRVREILDDEALGLDERKTMIDLHLRASGQELLADKLRTQGAEDTRDYLERVREHTDKMDLAQKSYARQMAQLEISDKRYEAELSEHPAAFMLHNWEQDYVREHKGEQPTGEQKNAAYEEILKRFGGGVGGKGLEVSKQYDIVDEKGKIVRSGVMLREFRDRAGFVDSDTGEPLKLEPGQHPKQVSPSTSGGGRAGAQVIRQQVGGREVLSDLQNAVNLPVGTTIGPLGTYHAGTSALGALQGDLGRAMTDKESQLMQASMASMTRELSILMSPVYGGNWAARQIDPLIPQSGDFLGTILFKLARLAQSADNALEAVSKSPILSNEQREYSIDLQKQIQDAIPWTPKQAMDFAHKGGEQKETFGDFVKKNVSGAETGAGSTHDNPMIPKSRDEYLGLPKGTWYKDQDGHTYQKQSDAVAQ